MASAPFSLNITTPANTDIAANYPSLDRNDKDIIQSWITVQTNAYGHQNQEFYDGVGTAHGPVSAPTASAGSIVLYYDSDKAFKVYNGDFAAVDYVGVPPGTIMYDASPSTPPPGWLVANGAAVSRTTYSRLFARISTNWGGGDGSTTFNLPNAISRFVFGGSGISAGGGTSFIASNHLPNYVLNVNIPGGQGNHSHGINPQAPSVSGTFVITQSGNFTVFQAVNGATSTQNATLPSMSGTTSSINLNQTQVQFLPPYIQLVPIIKY